VAGGPSGRQLLYALQQRAAARSGLRSRSLSVMHSTMPRAPDEYIVHPIGVVRSSLESRVNAPRQGVEGAPDAWIELDAAIVPAMSGLGLGDEVVVVTWLHQADRQVLEVHPRGDATSPLAGVFATRSPDRPNPIGLHRVTLREFAGARLRVGPLEAIDGTPVIDIKIAIAADNDELRPLARRGRRHDRPR
jgi:tRNA-Thr(GGU) m(6)t(6)A37 methyltransferase TsaA